MASQETTRYSDIDSYVSSLGGTRAFKKVLLANNGISAVKAIRSIRKWCYETFGNEREIQFIAMATPEDLKANAEYIRMADRFTEVPAGSNANNYANVTLICQLASRFGVDAVWAGWGHASENPSLPKTLGELGITFIGPSAGPMHALGDKIGSTIIAQSAGVPTIGWNGQDLTVNYKETREVPQEVYDKANVCTVEDCVFQVEKVGVPVMIKASEGGGGKGIRLVSDLADAAAAFRQVQSEVAGSPIFVMKLLPKSRHLEVQLLADNYGNAIALNGRDCSIQRRHQKILEEGPPIAANAKVWKEMEQAAVRLAKEVGYSNAGTVEYLFCEGTGEFFFLELNPRLQVEHPVTEMIMEVNLPALQFNVAMGLPLHKINDIRKLYGEKPAVPGVEPTEIDFDNREKNAPSGHVIAARITAENPFDGFSPTSGKLIELNFRSSRNVWGYFSVDSSGNVHEFADSQIGHLFSWGEDRESARTNLALALKQLTIRGEIRTTVEYLHDLIEAPEYVANQIDTAWLDKRIQTFKNKPHPQQLPAVSIVRIGATCVAAQRFLSHRRDYLSLLSKGQMPPQTLLNLCTSTSIELIHDSIKYQIEACASGEQTILLECNGSQCEVEIRPLADDGFLVILEGKSHVSYLKPDIGALRLQVDGRTCLFHEEYDPSRLKAKLGGKLLRYLVKNGEKVLKNQPFAEIEVMKMNMQLLAQETGVITLLKPEGAVMEPGDLICEMEIEDSSKINRAKLFAGKFFTDSEEPTFGNVKEEKLSEGMEYLPHQRLERANQVLLNAIRGFIVTEAKVDLALKRMVAVFKNPFLPLLELEEALSRVKSAIPNHIHSQLIDLGNELRTKIAASGSHDLHSDDVKVGESDLQEVLNSSRDYCVKAVKLLEQHKHLSPLEALITVARRYENGIQIHLVNLLGNLLDEYHGVEKIFGDLELSDAAEKDDVMQELRRNYLNNLDQVLSLALAHNVSPKVSKARNQLAISIMGSLETLVRVEEVSHQSLSSPGQYPVNVRSQCVRILRQIGSLKGSSCTQVALEARQVLLELQMKSLKQQEDEVVEKLLLVNAGDTAVLEDLVSQADAVLHFLISLISRKHTDAKVKAAAIEVYVRRVYAQYQITDYQPPTSFEEDIHSSFDFRAQGKGEAAIPGAKSKLSASSSFEDLTTLLTADGAGSVSTDSSFGLDLDGASEESRSMQEKSLSSVSVPKNGLGPEVARKGLIAFFPDRASLEANFAKKLQYFGTTGGDLTAPVNVVHVLLSSEIFASEQLKPDAVSTWFTDFLQKPDVKNSLVEYSIRRVTFATSTSAGLQGPLVAGHGCGFFTFRSHSGFQEDKIVRNIETTLAFQLQLSRLANFNITPIPLGRNQSISNTVHVFKATPKGTKSSKNHKSNKKAGERVFVRAIVREVQGVKDAAAGGISPLDAYPGPEKVFLAALESLESLNQFEPTQNHLFLNMLGGEAHDPQLAEDVIKSLTKRYAERLRLVGVSEMELGFLAKVGNMGNTGGLPMRIMVSNPTGFALVMSRYIEAVDPSSDSAEKCFFAVSDIPKNSQEDLEELVQDHAVLHGKPITTPYPVSGPLDEKRARAAALGTAYVYDYPSLFLKATQLSWKKHSKAYKNVVIPELADIVSCEELVLDDTSSGLKSTKRAMGINDIGMVAWKMTILTPEFPRGRVLVVIANDITFKAGSFGTQEDELFNRASIMSRKFGYPRLYIAANSGARIGLADEVKSAFEVEFKDFEDPAKGVNYLSLSPENYEALSSKEKASVLAEFIPQRKHYKITDIIGSGADLGVENLRGSGTIAGETAKAYKETFTLTYVSGRTVGIGAYLVRLGQRTVQKGTNAPILLTGYSALNALMGSQVYTSNLQLGGPKVMFANGVSHLCVRNDLEGVQEMMQWVSYLPLTAHSEVPRFALPESESLTREVEFNPTTTGHDPRLLLTGTVNEGDQSQFLRGFFDKGSFAETLGGWARTVIVGRARLGGIPMGVIMSETRTVEKTAPADPASPDTQEQVQQQAGQVWFPDSAYKTAQTISDVNHEGLPLLIMANWRGFSGGQRDMFDQVLKFGSYIVDELVDFKQPVFVYLLPNGELRGGAWVVLDETINSNVMEMYADEQSRGGVLEPSGAASIKYRRHDILKTMHRVDEKLQEMDAKKLELEKDISQNINQVVIITEEIKEREAALFPIYKQISLQFADLHDRAGRMAAKKVIRKVIKWESSRIFFFNRLRRRLAEMQVQKSVEKLNCEFIAAEFEGVLGEAGVAIESDVAVGEYLESTAGKAVVEKYVASVRKTKLRQMLLEAADKDGEGIVDVVKSVLEDAKKRGIDVSQLLK